jgi:hypothetical protein
MIARVAIAALVAAVAAAAPAAARTTVVAGGDGAAGLTAYGGHLVWSQRDPHTHRWTLRHWHAGHTSRIAVPARAVPFDADAGPDAAGHPALAFSQCAKDPREALDWLRASGCRIVTMRLDVHDTPHPVAAADAPGTSATTPSLWRGSLAFVRHTDEDFTSHVLLLRAGATAPFALPDGTVRCRVDCDDIRILTAVESLDLGPRAAAFVWRQSGGDTFGISDEWFLEVDPLDGSARHELSDGFIDGACGFVYPFAPTAAGVGAFWVASGSTCETTETVFGEVNPATKRRREARERSGLIFGAARDGTTTYWLRASNKVNDRFPSTQACVGVRADCKIVRSTSLPWRTLRRGQRLGPYPEED